MIAIATTLLVLILSPVLWILLLALSFSVHIPITLNTVVIAGLQIAFILLIQCFVVGLVLQHDRRSRSTRGAAQEAAV